MPNSNPLNLASNLRPDRPFHAYYEEMCEKKWKEMGFPPAMISGLRKKMKLGFEKYKEVSFQSTFNRFFDSERDILRHILGEILDLGNYLTQLSFQVELNSRGERVTVPLEECTKAFSTIYDEFMSMSAEIRRQEPDFALKPNEEPWI